MQADTLKDLVRRIDAISDGTGRLVAWCTLGMVLVTFAIVVFRYTFDTGWIWLQESVSYLHAYVFMLGAAYTLRHDAHVRVDIFYCRFSPRGQALVDLLGCVLLVLPVCGFIFFNSWDNVIDSWQRLEGSEETGGLNLVYLLKTAMLLMPLLLALQAFAVILRSTLVLRGQLDHATHTQVID